MIVSRSAYTVRHPRGSYIIYPLLSLEATTPENPPPINSMLSSICKSASQAVLSRMQLTLHATRRTPHGASGLAQAMSAWSAESRPAPSRRCRDARVYIHSTTAMHDMSTPPVSFDASLAQRDTAKREALLQEIETLYTTMQSTNRTYRVEAAERRLVRLRLRSTLNLARLSGD